MNQYTIGIDFGTLSARAVVVNIHDGAVLATAEAPYRHGVISGKTPWGQRIPESWALQDPEDYIAALQQAVPAAVAQSGVDAAQIIGLGIDFTASTTLPVLKDGTPVRSLLEYAQNPHAYAKLWKHHGAQHQANEMTRIAVERNEPWLQTYGGKVNSEWSFPKLWQLLDEAPDIYALMDEWMEACDWMVYLLTGNRTHGAGFAGFKSMYDATRGFPDEEYFAALDERLRHVVRDKQASPIIPIGARAGGLTAEMAQRLGLRAGIAVTSSNCDGHVCAPAVHVTRKGQMMAIIGTSTGLHVLGEGGSMLSVPGICGGVQDGMIPGLISYEMGQSCVGDLFAWFTENCVPQAYKEAAQAQGISVQQYLTALAEQLRPGESGLMALDWWNGNRSTLVDSELTGLLIGMTLQTKPEEIYRALIEATAYGVRVIVENNRRHGLAVEEFVAAGGISQKNAMAMQIYADVLNMPVKVTATRQGPALGAAIWGAVAAGAYPDVVAASDHMHAPVQHVYMPRAEYVQRYDALYHEYCTLQAYFGQGGNDVMKRLLALKHRE